jgi:DNA-directed RNA polymerase subunit RPC12/RpoP
VIDAGPEPSLCKGDSVNRFFWAECPGCHRSFVVDWSLRHSKHLLKCPFCSSRFLADEAASIDERFAG